MASFSSISESMQVSLLHKLLSDMLEATTMMFIYI